MKHLEKPITIFHPTEDIKKKFIKDNLYSSNYLHYIIPLGISLKIRPEDNPFIIDQA